MNVLIIFTILTIANVMLSTIKSIVTVKCGKTISALVNALYYGFYNIVLIVTVADFSLYYKVFITFGCNLVGVFLVKWLEEKASKDKLWKLDVTVPTEHTLTIDKELKNIPHNYITISPKYTVFHFYCEHQKDTKTVVEYTKQFNARYFASENKI